MPDFRNGCLVLLLLTLTACVAVAPLERPRSAAAGEVTGEIDGAPFRIDMPEKWNGDLLMYLHGYEPQGKRRRAVIPKSRLENWFLVRGYAVAQSAYSSQGWAVAEALQDNERLRRHFISLHGEPRRVLLIGHSMGGHLVLAAMERHPQAYAGALSLCGANAPAYELFSEGLVAPLVAFEHFFPGAMQLAPGGLADPVSPPMLDSAALEAAMRGDEASAGLLVERYGILRKDLADGLVFRYVILREMMQRAGGFPVDTQAVIYSGLGDDVAFNATVRRYAGDPSAMAYTRDNASLTGRAQGTVVVLSNRYDPTVTRQFSSRYKVLAEASGNGANVHVLPSVGKGHCNFKPEDMLQAFAVLIERVDAARR